MSGKHHPDAAEVLADAVDSFVETRDCTCSNLDDIGRCWYHWTSAERREGFQRWVLDALAAAGLVVVREGEVPPWMKQAIGWTLGGQLGTEDHGYAFIDTGDDKVCCADWATAHADLRPLYVIKDPS